MDQQDAVKAAIQEVLSFSIFVDMPQVKIEELCSDGKVIVCYHKDILYEFSAPAKYFGLVLSGAFKLSRPTPQGEDAIIHFSTQGDVIGAFIMAQATPLYPVSVISMGPSRFLQLPRSTYLEKWKYEPDLIFKVQNLLSARMAQMHSLRVLQKAPLSARVAFLLLNILNKQKSLGDLTLPLPLTRREIAETLGASVETVIRVMSEWSKLGYIETIDQQIKILQMDKIIEQMSFD